MKTKIIPILLAGLISASVLGGCTTETTGSAADNSTSQGADSVAGEKKTLRVGIFAAGRDEKPEYPGQYIDENWSTEYIQKNFAEPNNIELKYEIIDNTNDAGIQNLQILMASQTAPDLFYVTTGEIGTVTKYAQQGALADLKPSLEKYGSNLTKFLTKDFIEKYGNFDGSQYAIPGREEIPAISHYWIRQDWLDVLNLKMPTNFDEWYSTMKAFKERASELEAAGAVAKAEDVIPYAMYHTKYFTDWERIVSRFYPTQYFDETKSEYYINSSYGTAYLKEGFKEGMQFMNTMYNEGLISKNFALDTDEKQFERDIVSGNAGSYCGNLFRGWGPSDPKALHTLLAQNIPGAKFEWCNPFTNKYDNVARNPLDNPVLTYIMVPSFSKSVDEAIKYLDFVAADDNMITIQYGEEGKTYDMDTVLGPMKKDASTLQSIGERFGGRELVMIGRLPKREWSRIQRSGAQNAEEAAYAEKIHMGIESDGYERFPGILSGAEENSLVGNLRTPWQQFLSDLIMAKPSDYDAVWDKGSKELEANGSLKVVDSYKKLIKEELGIE